MTEREPAAPRVSGAGPALVILIAEDDGRAADLRDEAQRMAAALQALDLFRGEAALLQRDFVGAATARARAGNEPTRALPSRSR